MGDNAATVGWRRVGPVPGDQPADASAATSQPSDVLCCFAKGRGSRRRLKPHTRKVRVDGPMKGARTAQYPLEATSLTTIRGLDAAHAQISASRTRAVASRHALADLESVQSLVDDRDKPAQIDQQGVDLPVSDRP